jgi:hypothetical protein
MQYWAACLACVTGIELKNGVGISSGEESATISLKLLKQDDLFSLKYAGTLLRGAVYRSS